MTMETLTEIQKNYASSFGALHGSMNIEDQTEPEKITLNGTVVLLVDDAPDVLHILSRILRKHGAEVITATSAPEAYKQLQYMKPDVIVSDIAMPGETGHDLMKKIRNLDIQEGGGTPAIALTAFSADADREASLSSGYQAHLTKPVQPPVLVHTIRTLVVPESNLAN